MNKIILSIAGAFLLTSCGEFDPREEYVYGRFNSFVQKEQETSSTFEMKGKYELVMRGRNAGRQEETEYARIPYPDSSVRFRAEASFGKTENVRFMWMNSGEWKQLGPCHSLRFTLDHFCGARFGLFMYATMETGGGSSFSSFRYEPGRT